MVSSGIDFRSLGSDSGKRWHFCTVFAGFCLREVMASVASSSPAFSRSFFSG
ncbi:unnamed protein product [Brassica napus]|uniref:(rape) hypothetical protein n=1 Tax=Brassica napus TaxID=3708 RepID=A0A816MFB7_BRANA|nr:unnamed protein product [Brassica napus]